MYRITAIVLAAVAGLLAVVGYFVEGEHLLGIMNVDLTLDVLRTVLAIGLLVVALAPVHSTVVRAATSSTTRRSHARSAGSGPRVLSALLSSRHVASAPRRVHAAAIAPVTQRTKSYGSGRCSASMAITRRSRG